MTVVAVAIVLLGVALTAGVGLAAGLDLTAATILLLIVAVGALAVAIVRKRAAGLVTPVECPSCGAMNSPNAPYCRHCGADSPAASR